MGDEVHNRSSLLLKRLLPAMLRSGNAGRSTYRQVRDVSVPLMPKCPAVALRQTALYLARYCVTLDARLRED
jgi:hypothetical protein